MKPLHLGIAATALALTGTLVPAATAASQTDRAGLGNVGHHSATMFDGPTHGGWMHAPSGHSGAVQYDDGGVYVISELNTETEPSQPEVEAPVKKTEPKPAPNKITGLKASHRSVKAGKKVTVTGKVPGEGRRVVVEFRNRKGWVPRATGTVTTKNTFKVKVPADWFGTHRWRVRAKANGQHEQAVSAVRVLTVKTGYSPKGSANAWRRWGRGTWTACQPIKVYLNPHGRPPGAVRDIKEALRRLSFATGYRFKIAGETGKVPFSRRDPWISGAIIIAWSTPRVVPGLAGAPWGLGGGSVYGTKKDGYHMTSGGVVLDRTQRMEPGFRRNRARGIVLMHELGHAMGLHHSPGSTQIMSARLSSFGPTRWGAGDLSGLRAQGVGNTFPCS